MTTGWRSPEWWWRRLTVVAAVSTAAVLALFGVSWLVSPAEAAPVFGIDLAGPQLAYGRVKGAEDLLLALAIGLFLARRDPAGLRLVLGAGLLVPAGDMLALALAGVWDLGAMAIHGAFAVVMTGTIGLLRPTGAHIAGRENRS